MLARACGRSVHDPPDLVVLVAPSSWPIDLVTLSYGPRHPCGPTVLVIPVAYEHRHPCDPADIVIL
jgi:hypothetical protein